jgi:hypothetical protein
VTIKGAGEGREGRVVLDRAPDGQRDPPTGDEHAMGLAQRAGLVGEELQALLTADQVEGCVGQRQPGRVRGVPLDGRAATGPRTRSAGCSSPTAPASVAALVLRVRRARGVERLQLTALLGLAYAGAVLVLGQLAGRDRDNLAVAGATLTVAALAQPARRRIQAAVDRGFNRRRYDAAQTIAVFSTRLREEVDLDTLTAELCTAASQTMEPRSVSLWPRPRATGAIPTGHP